MKVLVVAHESEFVGGANRALVAILKYWKENTDIQIDVLLPCNHGELILDLKKIGIRYYYEKYYKVFTELKGDYKDILRKVNVYRKFYYNTYISKKIANKLRNNDYDLVYSNTRMTSVGAYIAEELKIPHVIHIREFGNENTYWGPANIQNIYKRSSKIIAISNALASYLTNYVNDDKFIVLHDGVTYEYIVSEREINESKESDVKLNLLLTGRITKAKAQKDAVLALAKLKNNNIKLHFAGSVSENSKYGKEYYEEILALIRKEGLNNQVQFHGEVSDMKKLRQNMDVELMCAERETFGWVTVEGMRSGLLVIGSNTGATPEIINHGETGLLFEQGNIDDLANKIEWVIEHPEKANQIKVAGKKFTSDNFTIQKNAQEVYKVLKESLRN